MDVTFYKKLIIESPIGYAVYRIIFDSDNQPVDFGCLDTNPRFKEILNLGFFSATGKKGSDFTPESGIPFGDWLCMLQAVTQANKQIEFEYYSENTAKHLHVVLVPQEKFYCTVWLQDVTEQKRNLQKLIESEELENFFAVNPDLMCIADDEFNFIKLNNAWENILGYSIDELKSRNYIDYIHPDDLDDTMTEMIDLVAKQRRQINFINRYRTADGSYRYFAWDSQAFGKLIYATARDITREHEQEMARKQAEALLQSEREILSATLNSLAEGVILTDISGKITLMNPRAESITGFSSGDVIGLAFNDAFKRYDPITLEKAADPVSLVLQTGILAESPSTVMLVRKNGTEVYIEGMAAPVYSKTGQITGIVISIRDISKEYTLERELEIIRRVNLNLMM